MKQKYMMIINKIKKYYKDTEMLLEICLENYHDFNLYIRIDYYKKMKTYRLSWLDLEMYDHNFEKIISYEYLTDELVNEIKDFIIRMNNCELYQKDINDEYKVTINSDLLTETGQPFHCSFNRYINSDDKILYNLLGIVFENLPNKLISLFLEMSAAIVGNTNKYEYQEEFAFDLFNGELDTLFEQHIKTRGEDYYENGRVFFLEKLPDRYLAIVGGQSLYVITIKYDELTKRMQCYCPCPCEFFCKHLYAVIMAIRNNRFRAFYKLIPRRNNTNLLDRIMNFNFLFSIGIDDQGVNYLVVADNQIKLLPIINNHGDSDWEILADDESGTLTKRLKEILSK